MIYNGTTYNVIEYINKFVDLEALNNESNVNTNNETQTNTEV